MGTKGPVFDPKLFQSSPQRPTAQHGSVVEDITGHLLEHAAYTAAGAVAGFAVLGPAGVLPGAHIGSTAGFLFHTGTLEGRDSESGPKPSRGPACSGGGGW